jgi:hypothetical protein
VGAPCAAAVLASAHSASVISAVRRIEAESEAMMNPS